MCVHEIQDKQKEVKNEQKYLDLPYNDRSPTPNSDPLPSRSPSRTPSPTPSPEPFIASDGQRYRTGTLELLTKAPTHLKQEDDEKLLEEFFGDQITKLNELKTGLGEDDEFDGDQLTEMEVKLRAKETKKLKIPINPNSGPVDRNRMSYDVASEMEQLRARIQERARIELEDLDKKYSPKLAHPGFGLLESSNHSRQGSLDSSMPAQGTSDHLSGKAPTASQTRHSRQASLPVFFDPASVATNLAKKSPTPQLKTQMEKSTDNDLLSPSPPLSHAHVRQTSAGSSSSFGSGTISPPLTLTSNLVTSSHHTAGQGHVTGLKPYSTPPLIRSPQRGNGSQIQTLKERSTARPQSGKLPSQTRDLGAHHAHSHSQPAPLPSQFTAPSSKISYSTAIVKKRHSPEEVKLNGYTASRPPLPASHTLQMTKGDLDRPEIKSIARATQLRRAPSGEKVAASPRMGRDVVRHPPTVPGPSNTHQKLGMRLSESGNFQANQNGAQVHPEDIEPYMTSQEMRDKVFQYTPYTDKNKSNSSIGSGSGQNRQKTSLLPKEQTWC